MTGAVGDLTGDPVGELLDVVVLGRDGGAWQALNSLPEWFSGQFLANDYLPGGPIELEQVASPFLSHALSEHAGPQRQLEASRDIWQEDSANGHVHHYSLESRQWRGRPVILVRRLGADFQQQSEMLQTAREALLTNEQLEAEVHRRTQEVRRREEEIALRLLAASNTRDTETGSHVRRIGLYSAAMAKALGWAPPEVTELRVAAPMHDIGKIGIPDAILRKPGQLTPSERAVMETHAELGASLLDGSGIALLELAAEIARYHHERFDGLGYPRGLAGEDIPIVARIVAIADVYDALVHARVYKLAIAEQDSIDMMLESSGTQFDPALLQLFIDELPTMRRIRLENPDEKAEDLAGFAEFLPGTQLRPVGM